MNNHNSFQLVYQFVSVILISILIVACGGGGGEDPAATPTYMISGMISGAISGSTLEGVTVTLGDAALSSSTTDATGKYSFSKLANGNYTVTPIKDGFTFEPNSVAVNVSGANVSGPNFKAKTSVTLTHSISGVVTGSVKKDVLVTLGGAANSTTFTNVNGEYHFSSLVDGAYTVSPTLTGHSFSPISQAVMINAANVISIDFVSTVFVVPTYTITGAVSGATQAGVTINLTGGATKNTVTDANGNFSFTGLANGNYTVSPIKTGYSFNPSNLAVSINGSNFNGPFFTATANAVQTYNLTGTVTGAMTQNVLVTLSGAGNATTTTNASGNYSFTGLSNGLYTATPSLSGYAFSPSSAQVTVSGANTTINNFISSVISNNFTVSGAVDGAIKQGVTLNLTGTATKSTTTGNNGKYSFDNLANGSYTLTPVKTGYSFNPPSSVITVNGGNNTVPDFISTAITFTLSGTLTGSVLQNVLITLSGDSNATTTTNSSGKYIFSGLANGNYLTTPTLTGYTFNPASKLTNINNGNATADFVSTQIITYFISGKVTNTGMGGGQGVQNVTINLVKTGATNLRTVTTNQSGNYSIDLLDNGDYTLTPSNGSATFSPPNLAVKVNGSNVINVNFTTP